MDKSPGGAHPYQGSALPPELRKRRRYRRGFVPFPPVGENCTTPLRRSSPKPTRASRWARFWFLAGITSGYDPPLQREPVSLGFVLIWTGCVCDYTFLYSTCQQENRGKSAFSVICSLLSDSRHCSGSAFQSKRKTFYVTGSF